MHAVICLSDGMAMETAVFNSMEEAKRFKSAMRAAVGVVYDRIDICAVSTEPELRECIAEEMQAAGAQLDF